MSDNLSILKKPTIELDKAVWSVIAIGHKQDLLFSRNINIYGESLLEHNIRFVFLHSPETELSFYILDESNTVRAVVYQNYDTLTDGQDLLDIITSLQGTQPQSPVRLTTNPMCPNSKKIVGEYILGSPNNVDPTLLDFVVYAFALINSDGTFSVYSKRYLKELVELKNYNPNLKVTLAIGGWAADGFSDAALTAESRFKFAREAQKWVNEYGLDGIDLDWEYPGSSAAGIKSRKEDTANFTLLVEALRIVLGKNKLITVAGIANSSYIKNVEIAKIAKFIDYFNVMTYDFTAGNAGEKGHKHQGNLYSSELSLSNISVDLYVKNLINAGMPASKIIVGVAFYGRQGSSITKSFDEIRREYLNKNGYTVKFDNDAKSTYIADPDGNFFLSFENEFSIYYKGQYVIDNCLAGLFSWQSAFDQANILSSAINLAVNNPPELEKVLQSYYA